MLRVGSVLTDARVRTALRAAVGGADARLKTAGMRALCEARDPELLPDVLTVARDANDATLRTLAVRGYVRLVTDEESTRMSGPQRASALKEALAIAHGAEAKRLVLSGLATVPDPEALRIVLPMLSEVETQVEGESGAVTR